MVKVKRIKTLTDPAVVIAQKTVKKGEELMVQLQFRRKGLAASLLVIAAALVALFIKIREVDRRGPSG
jgi:hypothetical protein